METLSYGTKVTGVYVSDKFGYLHLFIFLTANVNAQPPINPGGPPQGAQSQVLRQSLIQDRLEDLKYSLEMQATGVTHTSDQQVWSL